MNPATTKRYHPPNPGLPLSLVEREVPVPARPGGRKGAADADKIVFPVLQHGLLELCVCVGGELPGRGEEGGAGVEVGDKRGPVEAASDECNREGGRIVIIWRQIWKYEDGINIWNW